MTTSTDTGPISRVYDGMHGLPAHYAITERAAAESMVVLMPAALASDRESNEPVFHRWSWASAWPDSTVLAFADPTMQLHPQIAGAWYIHPEHDVIRAIVDCVSSVADSSGIDPSRIVFYGSSLGGFGALSAAALLPGARAVAEVPQVDVAHWIPSVVASIEQHVTGVPLEEYRRTRPEQISIPARFEAASWIPGFTIITNLGELSLGDQMDLIEYSRSSGLPKGGPSELVITTALDGHKVFGVRELARYVRP